jgi:two-component system, NarL family, nitrate/nitrite response regulator NarL
MRILLADDHGLLRDGLSMLLRSESGFEVETTGDVAGALALIAHQHPFDLVILDINMPGMNGLEGMKAIQATGTSARLALISGDQNAEIVLEALRLGAIGFIPKSLVASSMILAVRLMLAGTPFIPPELFARVGMGGAGRIAQLLSPREREVLAALVLGKANKEIAISMELSEPSIKLHMTNIFRKIGVKSRTQAALLAREEGWQVR